MKKISIIAPCYNEANNVEVFYKKIHKIFEEKLSTYDYELIIVDDCSDDGSVDILRKISHEDQKIKVILNNTNYGVFQATFNAIKYSSGDALIPMLPVDMQDTPELIIEFVKYWEQ